MDDSTSDLSLEVIDLSDFPDRTAEVLGAVHYLHSVDRRVKRGAIRERVGDGMTREQVRYRLDKLVDEDLLSIQTYQEHNQIVNEYYFKVTELAYDAKKCYEGCRILDDDEIADPSRGTVIALAGRVADNENRLDDIEEEIGINDGDDDPVGLSRFIE